MAFQGFDGFSEGICKGKGGKKALVVCVCVYIRLGEHWEESIRRAYGARGSPQAWSFGVHVWYASMGTL